MGFGAVFVCNRRYAGNLPRAVPKIGHRPIITGANGAVYEHVRAQLALALSHHQRQLADGCTRTRAMWMSENN
jgi:hypothetical protein